MATPRMRTFISGLVLALLAVGPTALAPGPAAAEPERQAALPDSVSWSSTGPLIAPQLDADHPIVSVKDPTVFRYKNRWHVYMTTANTAGAWSVADELRFPGRSWVLLDAGKRSVVLGGVWTPAGGPWAVAAGCGAGAHGVRYLPPVAPLAAVLR